MVGSFAAYSEYPLLGIMQTYPQLVDFDPGTYEYFVEQYNLCGYNLTLQYPAPAPYPPLRGRETDGAAKWRRKLEERGMLSDRYLNGLLAIHKLLATKGTVKIGDTILTKRQQFDTPHLTPIGKINTYWGCGVKYQLIIHASTTLMPWSKSTSATFYRSY